MTLREAQKACPGWRIFRAAWGKRIYNPYRAFRNTESAADSYDTIQVDFWRPKQGGDALSKLVAMVKAVDAAGAAPPWTGGLPAKTPKGRGASFSRKTNT